MIQYEFALVLTKSLSGVEGHTIYDFVDETYVYMLIQVFPAFFLELHNGGTDLFFV